MKHPALSKHDASLPRSERIAQAIASAMGSVRFLVIATLLIICWVVVNFLAVALRWDPYPFILLNLVFSLQAFYAAPLILLASKQAEQRRDAQAAADHKNTTEIHEMTLTQMTILEALRALTHSIHEMMLVQNKVLEKIRPGAKCCGEGEACSSDTCTGTPRPEEPADVDWIETEPPRKRAPRKSRAKKAAPAAGEASS